MKYYKPQQQPNPTTQRFIFATGIECSYPSIQTPHGAKRVDEMEKCHHYERWREDFELTRGLGIRYLRYGPPYYRIHVGPARYDWSWTDLVLPEMRRLEIVPVMDFLGYPTGWAPFRTLNSRVTSPTTQGLLRSAILGCGVTHRSTKCT